MFIGMNKGEDASTAHFTLKLLKWQRDVNKSNKFTKKGNRKKKH